MITGKKPVHLAMVLLVSTLAVGFSEVPPTPGKVDPMLSIMTKKGASLNAAKSRSLLKSVPGVAEPLIGTILRFEGNLSGVKSLGGRIRSVIGDIATVDIPLHAVNQVAQLPNVIYIEAAKPLKHRLNISVPQTGASTLRTGTPPNWTGATGKGVIIGIVDTGIDLNHSDFKNVLGKTRVLSLWDQAATTGTPPSGQTYGNECTKSVIDAGGCIAVTTQDTGGHGTHVAGIAAGNGSATGNGYPAYFYIGMAPEADLIIANALQDGAFENAGLSDNVLDGIAYIQAKAAALGKPSVINLSLGSHDGPHDGTSNYERALDNASGIGKVIIGAAGNEADDDIHAGGKVFQGGVKTVTFQIPAGQNGAYLNIWYAGADQMAISVSKGTCTTPMVSPVATQTFQTACGRIDVASSNIQAINGDRSIAITLSSGASPLTTGGWSFTLIGSSVTNGRFDAWTDEIAYFTSDVDTSITLDDSGTATKPISVGAYNTKNDWYSIMGYQADPTITLGDIAFFSSRGPRRSCSDITKCPSIQKPDIAAPGNLIMSALSAKSASIDPTRVDVDEVHIAFEGTSMATPHVTGAVALLLQAAPTLTSDEIKKILTDSTAKDSFTGTVPNNTWGYGKMDVVAAHAAAAAAPTLTVAKLGTGTGTVTSSPTGINCGIDCSKAYISSTVVTLTATTNTDSAFTGWSVDCSGIATSTSVTMTSAKSCTATFTLKTYTLTLNKAGTGSGTVAGGGTYNHGQTATVSATPDTSSVFSSWSGTHATECATGSVTMTSAKSCTATFNLSPTTPPPSDGVIAELKKGGGCFIATAAYGSYLDPHVNVLRVFRDRWLMTNAPGKAFVAVYYAVSPPIAQVISEHEALRFVTRLALTPVVWSVEYPWQFLASGGGLLLIMGLPKNFRRRGGWR